VPAFSGVIWYHRSPAFLSRTLARHVGVSKRSAVSFRAGANRGTTARSEAASTRKTPISFETIPGATAGFCDSKTRRIVVDADAAPDAQLRTLIHECAHGLGIDYTSYSRAQAEVIVGTVIFWLGCCESAITASRSMSDSCHPRLGHGTPLWPPRVHAA
jgi:hypothetical protein